MKINTLPSGDFSVRLKGTLSNIMLVGIISFFRNNRAVRLLSTIVSILCLILGIGFNSFAPSPITVHGNIELPFLLAGGILLIISVLSRNQFVISLGDTPSEEQERKAIQERVEAEENAKHSPSDFTSLELETARINEYYTINQAQARSSYTSAILFMILGMGTIIGGVWIFYLRQDNPDKFVASLTTVAGIVINGISWLFLNVHDQTQKRSMIYFEKLSNLEAIGIAIRVNKGQVDPDAKRIGLEKITSQLLELTKPVPRDQKIKKTPSRS